MKRAAWGEHIRGEQATSVQGHRWIVEHAYGVIVTTRALEAEYRRLNDNVHVCRNSIDPDDWPKPSGRDETFRIGWYASNSHDRDAPMVAKALSLGIASAKRRDRPPARHVGGRSSGAGENASPRSGLRDSQTDRARAARAAFPPGRGRPGQGDRLRAAQPAGRAAVALLAR